ncbi:MAG TPA: hypothetical protein EYQ27_01805 [Gemmatimonadetes bacterium]|nr:hypothetical protein [Gemmatimonadota bacterium]
MSTTEKDITSAVGGGGQHDHHEIPWIRKYVFATDHKMIAKQFMFVSLFFLVVGGALAGMMRFQLGFPGQPMPGAGILPDAMMAPTPNGAPKTLRRRHARAKQRRRRRAPTPTWCHRRTALMRESTARSRAPVPAAPNRAP